MTLSEFLLARIAEDEAWLDDAIRNGDAFTLMPQRMYADCEAKRRIVEDLAGSSPADRWPLSGAVRLLALPYADHPDYCEEWRP